MYKGESFGSPMILLLSKKGRMKMMKITDFTFDFETIALGNEAICVSMKPYKKDFASTAIDGYSYEIVLPQRAFEKISVKVEGEPLINPELFKKAGTSFKVSDFKDFTARFWKSKEMSDYQLSCKATGFTVLK